MEIAVQQSYGKKYDIIFDTTCLKFVLTFLLKEVAFFKQLSIVGFYLELNNTGQWSQN